MRPVGERQKAVFDLLRQLALGLGAYRLFPDDLSQPGFVAAADRIRHACKLALATGGVDAEIRQGRFVGPGGELTGDENLDRLASACYARNVEHIHVEDEPTNTDLATIFRTLSMAEEQVAAQGGVHAALRQGGVATIILSAIAPESGDELDPALADLSPEQLEVWRELKDPSRMAANLMVSGLPENPADAAQSIWRRFQTMAAVLPTRLASHPDFFVSMGRTTQELAKPIRKEVAAIAVGRAADEELAEGFLSHGTDTLLAKLFLELSEDGGPDPIDIARRVESMTRNTEGLADLTEQLLEDTEGTAEKIRQQARPSVVALTSRPDETRVGETVADMMASELLEADQADKVSIRQDWPNDPAAFREMGLDAWADYVVAEHDLERLGAATETWAMAVRDALIGKDESLVDRLLEAGDRAYSVNEDPFKHQLLEQQRGQILDAAVMRSFVDGIVDESEHDRVMSMLRRFDESGVDSLLDALAVEENRGTRAMLVGAVSEMVAEDVDRVIDRLADPRWFVVRNAVTILGRAKNRDAMPALVELLNHEQAGVRREVLRSLVSIAGADSVPYLRRAADDRDEQVRLASVTTLGSLTTTSAANALADIVKRSTDQGERERAINALGGHAAPEAAELLKGLISRRSQPRLPRALRKLGKQALKKRESS